MATQSGITLNTVVYNPAGTAGGISTWYDKITNGAQAANKLTESVRGPSAQGMFRVQFKLDLSTVASEDTSCACVGSVIGTSVATLDVAIPASFTSADRTNVYLQLKGLIDGAVVGSAIKDLEGSWG